MKAGITIESFITNKLKFCHTQSNRTTVYWSGSSNCTQKRSEWPVNFTKTDVMKCNSTSLKKSNKTEHEL